MDSPKWCHICSGTGIGFDGDECLCRMGAFEAQKPEPESPTFTGKAVYPVGYIAVAPDDYAELTRKAAAYNDLKAVIERLSCELDDLKLRFK